MREPSVGFGMAGVSMALERGEDGIATLTLATTHGSTIPIGRTLLRELDETLHDLEAESAQGHPRLLLIRAAAGLPILSGYPLDEIRALSGGGIVEWSQEAQAILRRLEQLPIPSVALVQDSWFGAAAELALACSHRVAQTDSEGSIAFPQTRRGLIPAWGGTVRLPRLTGLQSALQLIVTGDPVDVRQARDIGLIDKLIPADTFDERLQRYLTKLADDGIGQMKRKRRVGRRLIEDTAPGRRLLGARAARRYLADGSATLAARLALELMVKSSGLPLDQAFDRESTMVGELIVTNETQGRLHSEQMTAFAAHAGAPDREETEAAAVLGGGQMGSDFAGFLLTGGTPVRIKDAREAARLAVSRTHARIDWEVRQDFLNEEEGARRSAMVEAATGFGGFGLLDVAIVAPDGTAGDAALLVAELETHVRDDCLIAFHDWTLPPTAIQSKMVRPERALGLIPALPIDRFPLLEVIVGPETSPASVEVANRLARRAQLTAVYVHAPTPTPGLRLISVFFAEASRILEDGIAVDVIDEAMEDFGFALGPFRRIDGIGSRRVRRMLDDVADAIGARASPGRIFRGVAEGGRTFYRYRNGRPAGPAADLPAPTVDDNDDAPAELRRIIQRRILLLLVDEAARIVADGCVNDPADLEAVAILGLGFPREHGGLLYYAQAAGLAELLDELHRAESEIGASFAPSTALVDLVASGGRFFADPDTDAGHDSAPVLE